MWHSPRGTVHILSGASEAGLTRDSFLFQDKFNVLDYSTLLVLTWHVLTDMVRVTEGKINYIENDLKANENWFELVGARGSSCRV